MLARSGLAAIDDSIAIAAKWRVGCRSDVEPASDGHLRAALGMSADGIVEVDLVGDGPHALIAGTTGAGKSELLRTLVATLAAGSSPDDVTFVLIDYKGGSTFDACADLPHTVGVVTDLDDRLAERALVSLEAEIRRRERLLRDAGADDLESYRTVRRETAPLPRLVVVIDEFAAMAADLPGFLHVAGRCRPTRPQPRDPPRAGDAAARRRGQRRDPRQHEPARRLAPPRSHRRRRHRRCRRSCGISPRHSGPGDAPARGGGDRRVPDGPQLGCPSAAGRRRTAHPRRRRARDPGRKPAGGRRPSWPC